MGVRAAIFKGEGNRHSHFLEVVYSCAMSAFRITARSIGLAFAAIATTAFAQDGVPPDPTCPNCIALVELVAVPVPPWTTDDAYIQKFFGALPDDPARDCFSGWSPDICRHWLDPVSVGGGYWDEGVGIWIESVELSRIFTPNGSVPPYIAGNQISFVIHVHLFDQRSTFDFGKIGVTHCGQDGTETPSFRISEPPRVVWRRVISAAVVAIAADPATITTCTLNFSEAVHSSAGEAVPPLTWHRYTRHFPIVSP